MSLDIAHETLGWPSPQEVRKPSGDGARIFAELAQTKIENAFANHPDAPRLKVGVLARNSHARETESPLAIVAEFETRASEQVLRELHRLAWNFSHSPTVATVAAGFRPGGGTAEPPATAPLPPLVHPPLP